MIDSTQSHFEFLKELCDNYPVNLELLREGFPTARIWPSDPYIFKGFIDQMDFPQISCIFFPEDKLVKVSNGKVLEYKDFDSYIEQMMDLHY